MALQAELELALAKINSVESVKRRLSSAKNTALSTQTSLLALWDSKWDETLAQSILSLTDPMGGAVVTVDDASAFSPGLEVRLSSVSNPFGEEHTVSSVDTGGVINLNDNLTNPISSYTDTGENGIIEPKDTSTDLGEFFDVETAIADIDDQTIAFIEDGYNLMQTIIDWIVANIES